MLPRRLSPTCMLSAVADVAAASAAVPETGLALELDATADAGPESAVAGLAAGKYFFLCARSAVTAQAGLEVGSVAVPREHFLGCTTRRVSETGTLD